MLMLYYLVHTLIHGGIDVVTAIDVPTTSRAQYQRQRFRAHNIAQTRKLDVVTAMYGHLLSVVYARSWKCKEHNRTRSCRLDVAVGHVWPHVKCCINSRSCSYNAVRHN